MKCPDCGGKVEYIDNFCEDCGAEFCSYCGEFLTEGGFCPECDNIEEEEFWEKGELDRDEELGI